MHLTRHSRIVILILISILCIAFLLTYYIYLSPTGYKARENADLTKVLKGEEASYITLDGEPSDLNEFRDGVLLVNVWASWSPYTPGEHEVLTKLHSEFGDTVRIVALNRKEQKETALAYLDTIGKREGIEYIIDTTDFFFASFDGYAMPETIIFDEVGNIAYRKRGTLTYEEVSEALRGLIHE